MAEILRLQQVVMKIHGAYLISLLVLVACVEPSTQQPDAEDQRTFTGEQRAQVTERVVLCSREKARQFARQAGSPTELGMLAARACRKYISASALIFADGDEGIASDLYPTFLRGVAEDAALYIAELRSS